MNCICWRSSLRKGGAICLTTFAHYRRIVYYMDFLLDGVFADLVFVAVPESQQNHTNNNYVVTR